MKTSSILVAAGFAAASEAILLPPGSYDVDSDEPTFQALPFEVALGAELQNVKVECPGCPVAIQGEAGLFRTRPDRPNDSSHLELDFAIEHASSGDRLVLNGFELYPESDPFALLPLRATVKPDTDDFETQHLSFGAQDLGFSLRVNPSLATSEDGKNQLVSVDLQVIEIGNMFVQGLESVHVKVLKKPETGALMIAQIEKGESENPAAKPKDQPCQTLMCALKGGMDSVISQMRPKGCSHPGHSHHQMGNFAKMMGHGGNGAAHSHGHHGHHGHHGESNKVNGGENQIHYHPQRTWASLFRHFSYTVILPILIGIVAGISVSLIGMIVGTVIVGLWRVFVRGQSFFPTRRCSRRRSSSASRKAATKDAAFVEEKAGLMTNVEEDSLPIYTDEEDKKDSA